MEILTKEELQCRLKVSNATIINWMRLGMPNFRLPGRAAKPGKLLANTNPVRFVFEDVMAWLYDLNAAGLVRLKGKPKDEQPKQKGDQQ